MAEKSLYGAQVMTEPKQTQLETDKSNEDAAPIDPAVPTDKTPDIGFSTEDLELLLEWDMPFGRFKGWAIIDLPEEYLFWFRDAGWPRGRLGHLMKTALQLKVDGADELLKTHRLHNDRP